MEANITLMRMMYAKVIKAFAELTCMPVQRAARLFYNSKLFELISEGVADLHCRSEYYLAEELKLELQRKI